MTEDELKGVVTFLERQSELNLVPATKATVNSSFIYYIDVLPPEKAAALEYLDKGGPKPERKARVIIMR